MDNDKIYRQLSTKFLSLYISNITNIMLIENKNIINFFENLLNTNLKSRDIVKLPLWTIGGGEIVNMYSDRDSMIPTKDVDSKIILSGKYSLPNEFIKKSIYETIGYKIKERINKIREYEMQNNDKKFTPDYLIELYTITYVCNLDFFFKDKNICNLDSWKLYADEISNPNNKIIDSCYQTIRKTLDQLYPIYEVVVNSKRNLSKQVFNFFKNICTYDKYISTLNGVFFNKNIFEILKQENGFVQLLNTIEAQDNEGIFKTSNNTIIIPFFIMIPRFNKSQKSNKFLNFPYFLKYLKFKEERDGVMYNIYKKNYDKTTINNFFDIIEDLDSQIFDYFNLNEDEYEFVINNFFKNIELLCYDWSLESFINTKIVIYSNISDLSSWNIEFVDEGFIDIWSGYSSESKLTKSEGIYEGKLPTGDIPCIVEKIEIQEKSDKYTSYLKIPSVFWTIRDQVGMLVLSLRKQRVGAWTEDSAIFIDANHDPLKYCGKTKAILKGMWLLVNNIKQDLINNNQVKYIDFIEKCKNIDEFDYIECGADGYISYLFRKENYDYWKRIGYSADLNQKLDKNKSSKQQFLKVGLKTKTPIMKRKSKVSDDKVIGKIFKPLVYEYPTLYKRRSWVDKIKFTPKEKTPFGVKLYI